MPAVRPVPLEQPTAVIPALQWPQGQAAGIRQWRDMTTGPSTPHEWPQPAHRESQPQNIEALYSDMSFSSSDDSVSNKRSRDVTTYLKYLVRGFLKQFRETSAAKISDGGQKSPSNESFVPSPKITFLIDEPPNLRCQICQQTPLKMAVTADEPSPSMTAILPCGHICCHGCIKLWLASHKTCPFCRANLTHKGCTHKVLPRLIAQDTIHTIPETLVNGGVIGDKCFKCAEKHVRLKSIQLLTDLARKFKTARRKAEDLGTDEAIEGMRKAQEAFERVPVDDFSTLSKIRHHQW